MTKLRLLPTIALAGALLLPATAAVAQDDAAASPAPFATVAADDPRLQELEALIPTALAGLPLDEDLQLATGEQLTSVMQPQEIELLGELLEASGKTVADYAAAATLLPISDTQVVYIQAHRVAGAVADEAIDAWVAILSLNVAEPQVDEDSIGGRTVTLLSDGANPAAPPLHMFPALDVVWMLWTEDPAIVGAAMDAVGADSGEKTSE